MKTSNKATSDGTYMQNHLPTINKLFLLVNLYTLMKTIFSHNILISILKIYSDKLQVKLPHQTCNIKNIFLPE